MMPALFMGQGYGANQMNAVASARRSYLNQMSQREEAKEKKQVRFQVRVKIHEFEKYLDDLSDGNEGESDDFGDGNEDPDPDGSKGAGEDQ